MALTKVHNRMIDSATFNVKDYGAVGDGVTDDRAAINLAFAAMEAAGGGTVFFPKATYYISGYIGNSTLPSSPISVSVIGEKGTVIESNPSSHSSYAFYLVYADLQHCYVSGFRINGNNKTARGIYIYNNTDSFREVLVEHCDVYDINIPNNTITHSGQGISVGSSAWSYRATVRNCLVENVSRDWWSGGQFLSGINCLDAEYIAIEDCHVNNVDWNGNQAQDADCIKVFSQQDGSGDYYKSVVTIRNNYLGNGYGRLLKLQTEGTVIVENNMFVLDGSGELITNWKGVDSQVADANINNNRFIIDDNWTGGSSADLVQLQTIQSANVNYNYEAFTQKFTNNNVSVRKTMPYGVIISTPDASSAAVQSVDVSDNVITYVGPFSGSDANQAFTHFIYTSDWEDPSTVTGQYYWRINNNRVSSYNFIRFIGTQYDYTNKLYIEVVGNDKFPYGLSRSIFYFGATDGAYTSNIKIADNQIGDSTGGSFSWPSNPAHWSNGTDIYEGDSSAGVISNMPANYRNARIYKRGGYIGVEALSGSTIYKYLSRDEGANWYQV